MALAWEARDAEEIASGETGKVKLRLANSKARLIRKKTAARKVVATVKAGNQAASSTKLTKTIKLVPKGG